MVDPISDMLTCIRNAQAVSHKTVSFPFSKIKLNLAETLNKEEYLSSVTKKGKGIYRKIEVGLKYKDSKKTKPFIQGLKRISKPGQRIYSSKTELNQFSKERGIIILSTSFGLMCLNDARKKRIGGEVLCRIW